MTRELPEIETSSRNWIDDARGRRPSKAAREWFAYRVELEARKMADELMASSPGMSRQAAKARMRPQARQRVRFAIARRLMTKNMQEVAEGFNRLAETLRPEIEKWNRLTGRAS